jgi:rubrerythrin
MNSKKIKTREAKEFSKSFKTGELARYLFDYLSDLLTDEEKTAYKNTLVQKKIDDADSEPMKRMLRKHWLSSDERVLELLKDGEEAFFRKLEERVLRDNPDKDFMNLCPKCGYLTITPKAKQCRKCYHSWHVEVEK